VILGFTRCLLDNTPAIGGIDVNKDERAVHDVNGDILGEAHNIGAVASDDCVREIKHADRNLIAS
jgi:hypothetical protein